jgi:hypothetical protein
MTEVYRAVQYDARLTLAARTPPEWSPPPLKDALWVEAIDPGETTGVCMIAVPRGSIFGDVKPELLHRETFELTGTLRKQVSDACWYSRQVSNYLDRTPVLIVCEDFDLGGNRLQGSAAEADVVIPVRWAAALRYAVECGHAERNPVIFQGRTIAFQTWTDERLMKKDYWDVGSAHKRDATRHALTALRRVSNGTIDADEVWRHPA